MAQTALQRLKDGISSLGLGKKHKAPEDHRFFNASELACLEQQLRDGNAIAKDVAKRNGARLNPRVAALKAAAQEVESAH